MCANTETEVQVQSEATILRRLSKVQVVSDVYELAASYCKHAKEHSHYFAVAAESTEQAYCKVCGFVAPYLDNERVAHVDQVLVSKFDQVVETYPQISTTPLSEIVSNVQVAVENTKQMVREKIMGPAKQTIEAMPNTAEGVEKTVNATAEKVCETANDTINTAAVKVGELKAEGENTEDDSEITMESIGDTQIVPMKDNESPSSLSPEKRSRSNSQISNRSLKQRANSLILNIPRHGVAI